jgi:putative effector of murein hydrolase LrgA (UPF0299 family)
MNCLKNWILKGISIFAMVVICFLGATLDSYESLIVPVIVFGLCILWLVLMYCANKDYIERSEDKW